MAIPTFYFSEVIRYECKYQTIIQDFYLSMLYKSIGIPSYMKFRLTPEGWAIACQRQVQNKCAEFSCSQEASTDILMKCINYAWPSPNVSTSGVLPWYMAPEIGQLIPKASSVPKDWQKSCSIVIPKPHPLFFLLTNMVSRTGRK